MSDRAKAPCIVLAGGGTGGHVFPMIAVADALKALRADLELVFVGTERGMEARLVPERNYRLELLRILPIRGGGISGALRGIGYAVKSLPESRALLRKLQPSAVFSIGGYAAGPVSLAAKTLKLPVALMEPNSVIGLANRLIAPLVDRAYTAFEASERHFKPSRLLRTGVPIRAGFDARPYPDRKGSLRVLVLGGSQGAKSLNEAVPAALAQAKTPIEVVHQTGSAHEQAVRQRYATLGASLKAEIVPFIENMPEALARAHLVVSRSGAGAVSEICAVGRPSLLVPYPFAAGDHQRINAEALVSDGAAVCIPSESATAEGIGAELARLLADPTILPAMAARAERRGRPRAAAVIARDLLQLAGIVLEGAQSGQVGNGSSPGLSTQAPLFAALEDH